MNAKGKVFSTVYGKNLPVIARGEGIYLYDEAGREYMDSCAGIAVVSIGHGRQEIALQMAEQAKKIAYCAPNHFENVVSREFAEELATVALDELKNFFFTSGGSENNESIMKFIRQYFIIKGEMKRHLFISRNLSFHGATLGALSLCGVKERTRDYESMLLQFPKIPAAFCYHCYYEKSYPSCGIECAKALENAIIKAGPENVAGFFAEPVVNTVGAIVAPKEYFNIVSSICKKYGVIYVDDEVITGFGRLGKWFGIEHWKDVVPDIISCGKGVSGGYSPLGVCMISDKIAGVYEEKNILTTHLITFQSNPLSAMAGLATFKIFKKEEIVEHAAEMGNLFHQEAKKLMEYKIVGDVRGLGMILGVEIVADKKTKKSFAAEKEVSKKMFNAAKKEGFIVYAGRVAVNNDYVDYFQMFPPLIITEDQIMDLLKRVGRAISTVEKELLG